ncbi:hypothetical protein BpHYR1_000577 [Brachionus plicatilis]|uniref:Uncharacterized protein n=1 Tax=Brachionus plicatilis TaxID=10195 RepID=A0A3M7T430_BRAPC|nr:hypothetical protein BpHYR1_000577 [Brachionus plicatilis]
MIKYLLIFLKKYCNKNFCSICIWNSQYSEILGVQKLVCDQALTKKSLELPWYHDTKYLTLVYVQTTIGKEKY